ncbi:hypothetical protein A1O1_08982 [Capronia coronata CBS 617.96]|uniref:Uncharacterized protein n=1 Tax=Capronia coronata CBS 617.96 TaxID=1182541 RepID=W9XNP3_9EURO|nr:uncharacterized protein A1O1_08982 [Capronia coronata CBS 617.96]EXJ78581.1 hypothetical protein A1O1_08982 [Capronia coronata CBS 617.96]
MAKSLDDLIQHLLEEIALSGSQGVTINDIAAFTSAFYHEPNNDHPSGSAAAEPLPTDGLAVDPPFLAKIWTWLRRHPDVSIGHDREYNGIPLAEIERRFPGYLSASRREGDPANETDHDDSDGPRQSDSSPKPRLATKLADVTKGPRVRVNVERVYEALCGHPPDSSKVSPLEFDLLSLIAPARSNGILQGDLRQASGQDKRSVPKRTDALHKKGYIVKETVYRKGNRTSRLILRRFAPDVLRNADSPVRGSTVRDVVRRICDVLSRQNLISQTKLAEDLNLESAAESAALVKILRRLEHLKCVKRARTATGPSATVRDLQHFVQLLHLPTPEDLERFDTEDLTLEQPLQGILPTTGSADYGGDIVAFPATENQEGETGTTRHMARWNPDRPMPNVVVDAVQLMGMSGLSNWDARRMITGVFVRRTLESLLNRISSGSLIVQPPHFRHLAVVRVAIVVDGVAQYNHYSWDVFRQMAEKGEVDISQIPGAKQALEDVVPTDPERTPDTTSVTSVIKNDQFGFPLQASPPLQYRNGEASFEDLIRSVAPGDVVPRLMEPIIVEKDGVLSLAYREGVTAQHKAQHKAGKRASILSTQSPLRTSEAPKSIVKKEDIPLGRPRKYLKGTEKFWRLQFQQARINSGASSTTSANKRGLMQDPAGLALYARRPADFDQTLLQAIEAGLPIPGRPDDISDAWVVSTRNVLNRDLNGVFLTPQGVRSDYAKFKSQIMIIKTPRLKQVDLHDRSKAHPYQFMSSMAAHSFAYRRFYPSMHITKQSRQGRVALTNRSRSPRREKKMSAPPLGVFSEGPASQTSNTSLPGDLETEPMLTDTAMEATDEEPLRSRQPTEDVKSFDRPSMIPAEPRRTAPHSPLSLREATLPSENDLNDLAEQISAPAARRASSPQLEPPHLGADMIQPLEAMHSPLLHGVSPAKSTTQGDVIELNNQDLTDAVPPAVAIRRQSLAAAWVSQDSPRSLPASLEVDEANNPSSAGAKASIVEMGDRYLSQNSQVGELKENELQPYDPSGAPVVGDALARASKGPSRRGVKKCVSRHKAQDDDVSQMSGSEVAGTPRKQKKSGTGKYTAGANALCRSIVLQLVTEASGIVPNDPSTLKRISAARWQEAGAEDRPLLKAVKAAIKSLCQSGKLKQLTFTFRGKSGNMIRRAVLFLPTISPLSNLVEDVKQKMIDADPTDYIPPEWVAEGFRAPLIGKNAPRMLIEEEDVPSPSPRRRRVSSAMTETTVNSESSRGARRDSRSRTRELSQSPPPRVTAATGFLTLKVPSLGRLSSVQIFNWRTEAPVKALQFEAVTTKSRQSRSAAGRARGRTGRKPTTRPAGRKVMWANQQCQEFPSSLEDILRLPDLKISFDDIQSGDSEWQRFACEVEGVRAWEGQEAESFQLDRFQYAFINHTVPPALYSASVQPGTVEFASLISFDEDGSEVEVPYPPEESWAVFVSALQQPPELTSRIAGRHPQEPSTAPPPAKAGRVRRTIRPTKRKRLADGEVGDEDTFVPQVKRRKAGVKGSGTPRPRRRLPPAKSDAPTTISRGVQYLRILPEETIYRIAVSVVVVRTLAGGIESYVDWPLVMTLFPDQEEEFIRRRWKTLLSRYRSDIRGLTENLQWKYLEALEAGDVPSVNFQDLKATDWRGIVDWALNNLDKFNSRHADDLPATRDRLSETVQMAFNEPKRSYHLLTYNANVTNPFKEDVSCSIVFGTRSTLPPSATVVPGLHYAPRYELGNADADLRLARSWVFATSLTPESRFDPSATHAKLSTLASTPEECEALLSRAVRVLREEKLLQPAHRPSGQVSSVRGWEGSRKLFELFEERRMINVNMLRRAVTYKLAILDEAFQKGESVVVEKQSIVDDGDMVAILNLTAAGQITAKPGTDVPDSRYGIDHERIGYRTRNMDKKLLNFSAVLVPTEAYVFGNPRHEQGRQPPIPRGQADEPKGHIPPWIDIHGNVQPALWEMFLVGVIGLIVQLPGVTSVDISRALGYALDHTEVELILDWCIQEGFAQMDMKSKGYETTEDWWWCIATGHGEHEFHGENEALLV